jgi:hypothetical protein
MDKFQEKKLVNFLKVSELLEVHKNELFKDKNILRVINVFIARLDSLQQELILAARSSNEITTELLIARSLVIKLSEKISSALKSFAKENDFDLLKRNLYVDFNSLSDNELLEYSKEVMDEALSIEEALTKSHLKNSELSSYRNLLDNLAQIVRIPTMMFGFRAKTSESFDENIAENEKLLTELEAMLENPGVQNFRQDYLGTGNFQYAY